MTTDDSVFCDRGDVICQPGSEPTYTQDVRATVIWLSKHTAARGERMIFKCATQEIPCKIETITRRINSSTLAVLEEQASHLEYLDVGEVVLHTKKPVAVEAFTTVQELGRFVLVKDENTCAGGIVTAI